jgi:hydroxymethylbilane synthase
MNPVRRRASAGGTEALPGGELVLATRASDLALAQTQLVGAALAAAHPGIRWRLLTITTRGDLSARATRAGGRPAAGSELATLARAAPGLFTSEVAASVARGDAGAAVHSLKDLPLDDHAGLGLAAILPRAAAGDVLAVAPEWFDPAAPLGLRGGATVGTSSPRRAALLRHYSPQAHVVAVRGNVPTRLRRCRDGELGAVVLAHAGLERLAVAPAGLRVLPLPPQHWQPAPGQGALAVQARRDGAVAGLLAVLDHAPTRIAVELERAVLRALGGGCAASCGAWARPAGGDEWELCYGMSDRDGRGWRSLRVYGTAAGCRRALEAWAAGGPPPGDEVPAEAAHNALGAVLLGGIHEHTN